MAKKSAIENNKRKMRLVKQFANRRTKLKAIANNDSLPMEERFEARIRLGRPAAQFLGGARPQSLRGDRPSARQLPQDEDVAHRAA